MVFMQNTQSNTADSTALYRSESGPISRAKYAPCRGSDTWNWERWQSVPTEVLAELNGDTLRCESREARRG